MTNYKIKESDDKKTVEHRVSLTTKQDKDVDKAIVILQNTSPHFIQDKKHFMRMAINEIVYLTLTGRYVSSFRWKPRPQIVYDLVKTKAKGGKYK